MCVLLCCVSLVCVMFCLLVVLDKLLVLVKFIYFIYLFAHKTLHTYCHVQREQDNKAQITGTNSCPLSLNHTSTDTNTMQCNAISISKTL